MALFTNSSCSVFLTTEAILEIAFTFTIPKKFSRCFDRQYWFVSKWHFTCLDSKFQKKVFSNKLFIVVVVGFLPWSLNKNRNFPQFLRFSCLESLKVLHFYYPVFDCYCFLCQHNLETITKISFNFLNPHKMSCSDPPKLNKTFFKFQLSAFKAIYYY